MILQLIDLIRFELKMNCVNWFTVNNIWSWFCFCSDFYLFLCFAMACRFFFQENEGNSMTIDKLRAELYTF